VNDATWPVVVIGAGAAGLMAAAFAAEAGARVLLVERTRTGGKKIVVSGGGRCNVLPSVAAPERFVTASSPHTLRRMLLAWPLAEQRRYFEETLGLPLVLEAETGKLFPASGRATDVRGVLLHRAHRLGVTLRTDTLLTDLRPGAGGWAVGLGGGETIRAGAVVLATGGLSVPNTGSDGTGLHLARTLGHTVHPLYAALTPLTADPAVHAPLAGVSLRARIEAPGARPRFAAEGGFLFTHRGYSGPVVLDASHVAVRARLAGAHAPLVVQWTALGADAWERLLREETGNAGALLRRHLPARLAEVLLDEAGVAEAQPLAQLRRDARHRLVERLTRYLLPHTGDEGYKKAEVTGGGVALSEVDPRTLESRRCPGLFLCGELLDAFGPIGGHNFMWAWSTGRAAAHATPAP
jgi:predicted Rossmann fold flavoprotein